MEATLGSGMFVQVGADKEIWRSVYSKRSCWLAHYKMWEQILTPIAEMFDFKEGELPCSYGNCLYEADAIVRYTDKDPGVPCPKHATINDITVDVPKIKKQIILDNRPKFWNEFIR